MNPHNRIKTIDYTPVLSLKKDIYCLVNVFVIIEVIK
jgi:hypothetical protein